MNAPVPNALPADALANLRDVRLPEAVSWWPLAPGWWALAALLAIGAGVALALLARRRRSARRAALLELERLRRDARGAPDPVGLATALGVLMRRVLLAADGAGAASATLHGDAWSERLSTGPAALPAPFARWIAAAPYAGVADDAPDADALLDAGERWIRSRAR